MLNKFSHVVHVPGTLTADLNIRFTIPSPCTLVHVSFGNSAASDATIDIGTSADTDGYLDGGDVGDSNTPAEFDLDDFTGALITDSGNEYPRLADGDIMVVIVDYDGASGTAAANATIVLTFLEG